MKQILTSIILFFSVPTFANVDLYDAFTTTTTCAIILGAASSEAEKEITFDPNDEGVFIADWIEIRLAANTYEDASRFYAKQILAIQPKNDQISYEYLVDEVYRGISEFGHDDLVNLSRSCIIGYVNARKLSNGKEIRI